MASLVNVKGLVQQMTKLLQDLKTSPEMEKVIDNEEKYVTYTFDDRQIGFDDAGRPVIYASFCQAISSKNMSNDAITHLIYTIENAIKSMKSGVTQWVFVIDCTGK
ncbi:Random slug protein 5 [Schistosoma japonicum]|nr:Random slug protein 5 [Schistosoma japonicum]